MITGVVTADHQAIIRLSVRGPTGQEQEIDAIIDTGFDGWLSLPCSLIVLLSLGASVAVHFWRMVARAFLTLKAANPWVEKDGAGRASHPR
jgi:hypothetical protein